MASIAAIAMLNIQMVLFTQIHKPRRINEGIAVLSSMTSSFIVIVVSLFLVTTLTKKQGYGLPAAGCTNPSFLLSTATQQNST
jgi:hypothetical protein